MANLTVTPANVKVAVYFEQMPDGPVDEAVNAGQPVRYNTTTGRYTLANGSSAAEARVIGVAVTTAGAPGLTISVVRKALVELGGISQAYDAAIYLSDTDGTLADSAGTVSTVVGRVVPAWGATTADKLLFVDL